MAAYTRKRTYRKEPLKLDERIYLVGGPSLASAKNSHS